MTFISAVPVLDTAKTFQYCLLMRNNRRRPKPNLPCQPFWLNPKMQAWGSLPQSSLIMVKGTFQTRFQVKDFCVDMIELLQNANVPVLWTLKTADQYTILGPSAVDVLKHLVSQALRLTSTQRTDRTLGLSCQKFQTALTEDDWFDLLGSVLAGLSQIYLVVDVETLSSSFASIDADFSWPSYFQALFVKLSNRGLKTMVKVVLVSYGSTMFLGSSRKDVHDLVVPVKRTAPSSPTQRKQMVARNARGNLSGLGRGRGRATRLQSLIANATA